MFEISLHFKSFLLIYCILQKQLLSLSGSGSSSLLHSSLSRHPSLIVKPRIIIRSITAEAVLPETCFILPPRDDAAEYDDSSDTHNIQDDLK